MAVSQISVTARVPHTRLRCGLTTAAEPNALVLFGLPLAVAALILLVSPNFDSDMTGRQHPLGSDFLQEWVGGHIWLSSQSNELYVESHYRTVQHDPAIVGFDWPDDKYYPMVYPPFYYMLLSPLALLPYRMAMAVWLLFLGMMAGATIFCVTRYFEPAKQHWGKCLAAMMAFCPLLISLNMAHKSILLLFILTATWLLLYHRQPFKSGLVFGLIAFKPHLGIVIGLAMLLKGQWRFVGGCLASVGVLVGLSFLAGPDLCADYFQQCVSMGNYSRNGGYQFSQSHNIRGAVAVSCGSESVLGLVSGVVLIIAAGAMTVFSLKGDLNFRSSRFAHQFSVLVIATILLSPHFYVYDLAIMLVPIGLTLFSVFPGARNRHSSDGLETGSRILVLLCVTLFVLVGTSERIAETLFVQPTLPILLALAGFLVWRIRAEVPGAEVGGALCKPICKNAMPPF